MQLNIEIIFKKTKIAKNAFVKFVILNSWPKFNYIIRNRPNKFFKNAPTALKVISLFFLLKIIAKMLNPN